MQCTILDLTVLILPSYQLKAGVWKVTPINKACDLYVYVTEEVPFGFVVQGAKWMLCTTYSEQSMTGEVSLLLLVSEFGGLKEVRIGAGEMSIAEHSCGKILSP